MLQPPKSLDCKLFSALDIIRITCTISIRLTITQASAMLGAEEHPLELKDMQ